MVDIFVFRDNKIALSSHHILLIPEFRKVYDSDSSHTKELAFKEFNYIYQRADYRSYPNRNGLTDAQAHTHAVKLAQLPQDYIVRKDIEDAIERYKEEQETIVIKLNTEILKSFNNSYMTVKIINESIEYAITQIKDVKKKHPEDIKRIDELTNSVLDNQSKLINISKAIPVQLDSHKQYDILLKKEEETQRLSYGGGKIIASMNPNKSNN